jgi:hypothetical protein
MAITARLAPALGRHAATVIVLGFFNHWIAATAEVDTHSVADRLEATHGSLLCRAGGRTRQLGDFG